MKRYRAIATVKFGPGQMMQLDDRQAASRAKKIEIIAGQGTSFVTVKATDAIEFKAGELIGLPSLDRRLAALVEEIKPDLPDEGKPDDGAIASAMADQRTAQPQSGKRAR